MKRKRELRSTIAVILAFSALLVGSTATYAAPGKELSKLETSTPIKHLVVIYQENVSFDHYFGTYPKALNPAGEPSFHAKRGTPAVNGLSYGLLTDNPNLNPANGTGATNPFRLNRSQAVTRDQGHGYKAEQQAFDNGVMDLFPLFVGKPGPPPTGTGVSSTTGLNLAYFD